MAGVFFSKYWRGTMSSQGSQWEGKAGNIEQRQIDSADGLYYRVAQRIQETGK